MVMVRVRDRTRGRVVVGLGVWFRVRFGLGFWLCLQLGKG
jgi:hypothetical protein